MNTMKQRIQQAKKLGYGQFIDIAPYSPFSVDMYVSDFEFHSVSVDGTRVYGILSSFSGGNYPQHTFTLPIGIFSERIQEELINRMDEVLNG